MQRKHLRRLNMVLSTLAPAAGVNQKSPEAPVQSNSTNGGAASAAASTEVQAQKESVPLHPELQEKLNLYKQYVVLLILPAQFEPGLKDLCAFE